MTQLQKIQAKKPGVGSVGRVVGHTLIYLPDWAQGELIKIVEEVSSDTVFVTFFNKFGGKFYVYLDDSQIEWLLL
jgi:hypothetical protein